jgi:drug/metabolite transporter (DMT)-like permease
MNLPAVSPTSGAAGDARNEVHWFTLSLLTALFSASEAALVKRVAGDRPPLEMVALPLAYSLPFFLLLWPMLPGSGVQPGFWSSALVLLPLNLLGMTLSYQAIRISPLSLTMPFLAFTPLIILLTGFLVLGEMPSAWGAAGIVSIVAGSYVLNLQGNGTGGSILEPFRAMARERGPLLMLAAAAIYGVTGVLGKKLILLSSPLQAGTYFFLLQNGLFTLAFLLADRGGAAALLRRPAAGALLGAVFFAHIVCHFLAISLVQAAYMIAVKRLNGLFGVLYGGMLFREENLGWRLAGAALMAAGAGLIVLMG